MNMSPRVSVILPIYNGEDYVAEAIESVLAQTYSSFEVIVVNDGSRDRSAEIVKRYIGSGRIKYIEQANQGVASARNNGIAHALGEFIALLDQDDVWSVDKLEKQLAFMDSHSEVALLHARAACIDKEGRPINSEEWIYVGEGACGFCAEQLLYGNRIVPMTVLIRRDRLDEVGLFNQAFAPADDWDMWLRIALRFPLGFLDSVVGNYRIHDSNESKNLLKMKLSEIRVMESHWFGNPALVRRMNRKMIELKMIAFYEQTAEMLTRVDQASEAETFRRKADRMKLRAPWYYPAKFNLLITGRQWRFIGSYWYRIRSLFSSPWP